ncbi:MAG: HD domain-containing protein [Chitinivibrionales bacterium]|nr:HD domain-containing protein [Chitinivibrionales bacterium]
MSRTATSGISAVFCPKATKYRSREACRVMSSPQSSTISSTGSRSMVSTSSFHWRYPIISCTNTWSRRCCRRKRYFPARLGRCSPAAPAIARHASRNPTAQPRRRWMGKKIGESGVTRRANAPRMRIDGRPSPVPTSMVTFVRTFIEQHDPIGSALSKRYSFRRRFEHCYRCCVWAYRIAKREGGDREVVAIAALFHDIGKSMVRGRERHARLGARICTEYLTSAGYPPATIKAVAAVVADHVNHEKPMNHESRVVSDADQLDEIGALTVLWDSLAEGEKGAKSYQDAYHRLQRSYQALTRKQPCLHTATAKAHYQRRITFLKRFLSQLESELGH